MATPAPENESHSHLRWYEALLFRWLARSPRIDRIIVESTIRVPPDRLAPHLRVTPEAIRRLEALYHTPPEGEREP